LAEKRDGIFEQQLGTGFLSFKTLTAVLLVFFSGIVSEQERPIKITGMKAINIFLNKTELIIKF